MYIFCILVLVILFVLLIPFRLKIHYYTKSEDIKERELIEDNSYVDIYLIYFIKVKRIKSNKKNKANSKKEMNNLQKIVDILTYYFKTYRQYEKLNKEYISSKDLKKLNDSIYFEEAKFKININFSEFIINAYLISVINALINIYIALNNSRFNLKNLDYSTNISKEVVEVEAKLIIRANLIKIFPILLKLLFRIIKNKMSKRIKSKSIKAEYN